MKEKTCFAIMPFDKEFDDTYTHAIKRAAEARGYRCHRADQHKDPNNMIHELIRHISEAGVVVADLTGLNANVFYELGLAHCSSDYNKTIMIARNGTQIPFDIAPYRIEHYKVDYEGIDSLRKAVGDQIDFLERQGAQSTNPVVEYLTQRSDQRKVRFMALASDVATDPGDELETWAYRVGVLELLLGWPEDRPRPSIRLISEALPGSSRRRVFAALQFLEGMGFTERSGTRPVSWRLSEAGLRLATRAGAIVHPSTRSLADSPG
jgi:hypothetical protein